MEKEAELTHEKEAELTHKEETELIHKEEPELIHEIEITQNKKSKAMMHLDKMEADQLKAIDTLTDNHLKNLAKLEEMMLNHFPDELLDQEAVRFQKDGWEIFNIHRELMKKAQIKEAQKQAIERSKNKIPRPARHLQDFAGQPCRLLQTIWRGTGSGYQFLFVPRTWLQWV